MKVVVRRSAWRMWAIAIGAIPLLIIAMDVLTNRRITKWLTDIIFNPNDIQIFEPRDVIFAWAMLLFSGGVVLWGLKELFMPTKVIECRGDGIAFKLRGPFRSPDLVLWEELVDVGVGVIEDEGDNLEALEVKLLARGDLPEDPWGARWADEKTLLVLAQDWSKSPDVVVSQITEYAVEIARGQARERAARHLAVEEEE